MNEIPKAFLARIAEHNRNCWLGAAISLLGAGLAWIFYGAVFTGAVLLFEAIRTGDTNILKPPAWFYSAGLGLVLGLFLWAGLDRWIRRFKPPRDRAIIGWHLLPDVLFLPARMTLAIWEQIGARIVLSRFQRRECWRLLCVIWQMEHPSTALLGYEFPDSRLLVKLLLSLQLAGWIDLHGGDGDWYYRVRSDEQNTLRQMLPVGSPEEPEAD